MAGSLGKFWLSCDRFTILVEADWNGTITFTAPMARRFLGLPVKRLVAWMKTLGGYRWEEL